MLTYVIVSLMVTYYIFSMLPFIVYCTNNMWCFAFSSPYHVQ